MSKHAKIKLHDNGNISQANNSHRAQTVEGVLTTPQSQTAAECISYPLHIQVTIELELVAQHKPSFEVSGVKNVSPEQSYCQQSWLTGSGYCCKPH